MGLYTQNFSPSSGVSSCAQKNIPDAEPTRHPGRKGRISIFLLHTYIFPAFWIFILLLYRFFSFFHHPLDMKNIADNIHKQIHCHNSRLNNRHNLIHLLSWNHKLSLRRHSVSDRRNEYLARSATAVAEKIEHQTLHTTASHMESGLRIAKPAAHILIPLSAAVLQTI